MHAVSLVGRRPGRRGFTLIELLITIAVLGVATILVIPSMSTTGVLRVQAAVRQIVADITFAQADAMAYQSRRALWFGRVPTTKDAPFSYDAGNGYVLAEVNGPALDLVTDAMFLPDRIDSPYARNFNEDQYGGAIILNASFDGDDLLIFDELGGPVLDLTGPEPSDGGFVEIGTATSGGAWEYRINIAPMTGRVTVDRAE
ncbi:MAG: prepilin-type N-terminal cleavage/methylation domain-containing protein [Phycisphaerales bacterium]|nr:prepilin-type N-terminal cleavage/methylation domain-containing protein [Phycisphaerales bacterium]